MKRIISLRIARRPFRAGYIEIHHDRFLAAAHDHGFDRLIGSRVQFLMGQVRRNVNEISRPGFIDELEVFAPAETPAALDDVEHGFELSVMMRSRFGAGLNNDCAGPQFLRANARIRNGFGASHSGSLRRICIQLAATNDPNALVRSSAAFRFLGPSFTCLDSQQKRKS